MANLRVHNVAKELGVTSKVVLDILAKHKIEGKTNFSGVDDATVELVKKELAKQQAVQVKHQQIAEKKEGAGMVEKDTQKATSKQEAVSTVSTMKSNDGSQVKVRTTGQKQTIILRRNGGKNNLRSNRRTSFSTPGTNQGKNTQIKNVQAQTNPTVAEEKVEQPKVVKPETKVEQPKTVKPETKVEQPKAVKAEVKVEQPKAVKAEVKVEQPKTVKPETKVEQPKAVKPEAKVEQTKTAKVEAKVEQTKTVKPETKVEQTKAVKPEAKVEQTKTVKPETKVEQPKAVKPEAKVEQPKAVKPETKVEQQKNVKPENKAAQPKNAKPEGKVEQSKTVKAEPKAEQQTKAVKPENKMEQSKVAKTEPRKPLGEHQGTPLRTSPQERANFAKEGAKGAQQPRPKQDNSQRNNALGMSQGTRNASGQNHTANRPPRDGATQGYRPRPEGAGQGSRTPMQGTRPQGQGTTQRPPLRPQQGVSATRPQQGATSQGTTPRTGAVRPQGQGVVRPQGQGYGTARPAGQGTPRPAGQSSTGTGFKKPYNNNNGGGRSDGYRRAYDKDGDDDNKNQQRKKKGEGKGGTRPTQVTISGKEISTRKLQNKKYDKLEIQGTYAPRSSKPVHYNEVMGRKNKKVGQATKPAEKPVAEVVRPTSIEVGEKIAVTEFAKLLKVEASAIIKKLFLGGVIVTINGEIDFETAFTIADEFGVEVKEKAPEEDPTEIPEVEDDPALRVLRPPVVTVMGHVDHGKTSLLDAIRQTNVTSHEAGGITQHIGAYKVTCQGKPIVFLDTPGHEAFTAMRARGAQVTDIAVLVVAADDGVMPQTVEAINHAKAAKVPIIVAINKMDRPNANPEHVMTQLAEYDLTPESWGGDVIMVPVSAHQKTGINELLENILLVAEVEELKANPNLPAHGTIIEARLDKGRGPVATVIVERGTLHVGDTILAGTAFGKVRAMVNDRGEKVKKATPATPVEVLGLNDVPMAGDKLDATDEHIARSIAQKRIAKKKDEQVKTAKVTLEDLFTKIQEGELKQLNIVVKADVQGTIEALDQSLAGIKNDEVRVVVVHSGVGTISESDVMLASAANALIIGFNVRPDANARKAAEAEKVDIRTYRVIYDALNDVEAAIKGMLAPKFKETIIGHVEIRQVITISKNLIAGCYVLDGKVTNSSKIRLLRDGKVIHEGAVDSLRRFKDDVKEVAAGFECGLTLENYRDIKENDQLEVYVMEKVTDM